MFRTVVVVQAPIVCGLGRTPGVLLHNTHTHLNNIQTVLERERKKFNLEIFTIEHTSQATNRALLAAAAAANVERESTLPLSEPRF